MKDIEYNGTKIWKTQIIWGKQYGILFIPSKQNLFILRYPIAILSMKESSTEQEKNSYLKTSLKNLLNEEIMILMPKWENITGLHCSKWFIGNRKIAWGWCQPSTCKIMINEKLMYKPKQCLEYVILHELCHLKEGNHGKLFSKLLDMYMPNWRDNEVLANGIIPNYGKH